MGLHSIQVDDATYMELNKRRRKLDNGRVETITSVLRRALGLPPLTESLSFREVPGRASSEADTPSSPSRRPQGSSSGGRRTLFRGRADTAA